MNERLHPLTLSEVLDRTAQIYRARFLVFFGISVLPAATVFVFAAGIFSFMTWMGARTQHGGTVPDAAVWIFLSAFAILAVPLCLAAKALGEAAMTDAAARSFLGESITIRGAYKFSWKRGWRYIGLYTLQALAIFVVPAAVFIAAGFAMMAAKVSGVNANDNSPLFGGLLVLLMVVLGALAFWLLLCLCMAFPASVVESSPAWTSLKRGTQLSRGTRARMLLIYVLGGLLNQVLAMCLMIPVIIILAMIPSLQGQAHSRIVGAIALLATYGSFFAVRALISPLYGIAVTVFYFDQRIRKEAFDIEWMMQQAGMVPLPPMPQTAPDASLFPAAQADPLQPVPFDEIRVAAQPPAPSAPQLSAVESTPGQGPV